MTTDPGRGRHRQAGGTRDVNSDICRPNPGRAFCRGLLLCSVSILHTVINVFNVSVKASRPATDVYRCSLICAACCVCPARAQAAAVKIVIRIKTRETVRNVKGVILGIDDRDQTSPVKAVFLFAPHLVILMKGRHNFKQSEYWWSSISFYHVILSQRA